MASLLVVTDFDGTLACSTGAVSAKDREVLQSLSGKAIRVIATGRNLFSAKRVLPPDFPIDYLIFTSGAGIADWKTQEVLASHHLESDDIQTVYRVLHHKDLDFMVHGEIPQNHEFQYRESGRENKDFVSRKNHYRGYCSPLHQISSLQKSAQFLVIQPPHLGDSLYSQLRMELKDYAVIRASSPFDKVSLWVEIFHKNVAKENAASWIAARHGIAPENTFALGNDYNDIGLLSWASAPYVVENGLAELRSRHTVVASNENNGFSDAIQHWLTMR